MASQELISVEDIQRNSFEKVLHQRTGQSLGGIMSMIGKNSDAHSAAVDQYFQHWDGKKAEHETDEVRQARTADYASLTRQ